jgi:outer membrane receptor protein involved in Fe transport
MFGASVGAIVIAATPTAGHAQQSYRFDQPAQKLGDALRTIGSRSSTSIAFDPAIVRGKKAPAVKGVMSVRDALDRALSGSGLTVQQAGNGGFLVSLAVRTVAHNSNVEESAQPVGSETVASAGGDDVNTEIVVTGSHLAGAPLSSPVTVVDRKAVERQGYSTVADVLRQIPQNFSGGNSPQVTIPSAPGGFGGNNAGDSGGVSPNLRGLGASSTLTLVNGVRLADDVASGGVDVSLIPVDVIDRVEIVADGASAIYGSDAVGGVVNFILRRRYEGLQVTGQIGQATDGGGFEWRGGLLGGATWSTGGIIAAYEHFESDPVTPSQRAFSTADEPTYLLPPLNRESLFISAHQDLSSSIRFAIDAIGAHRTSQRVYNTAGVITSGQYRTKQMQIAPRLEIQLGSSWSAQLLTSLSRERLINTGYFLFGTDRFDSAKVVQTSRRLTAEIQAAGTMVELPAGPLRLALGGGHRSDRFTFLIEGEGAPRSRGVDYAYAEASVPILAGNEEGAGSLDLDMSGRYERYSDVGSSFVPKIGAVFRLLPELILRGTWGKSFRVPSLDDGNIATASTAYIDFPDPLSPTGVSPVLATSGGNPGLRPEKATTWSFGFDYSPDWLDRSKLSVTAFHIRYRDRIRTIANAFASLTDPNNAGYVIRNPSLDDVLEFVASIPRFFNYTDRPFDPTSVAALVIAQPINLAEQKVFGIDATFNAAVTTGAGMFEPSLSMTYLSLKERLFENAPSNDVEAVVFNPPRFRAKAGLGWTRGVLQLFAAANFTSAFKNPNSQAFPNIDSLTTFDLAASLTGQGAMKGFRATLSVENLFDKSPPFVDFNDRVTGINYDATNASPRGRFVSLTLQKSW